MANKTIIPPEKSLVPATPKANILKRIYNNRLLGVALGFALVTSVFAISIRASDYDDGEVDTNGQNLNLTDLYVFREKDQNASAQKSDRVFHHDQHQSARKHPSSSQQIIH